MMRSLYSGVSGLRTNQTRMDVIGNNIANVNTWGFKSYSYNFQDAISALEVGVIDLHDKIVVRDEQGERLETTAGRIILNEAVRNALA